VGSEGVEELRVGELVRVTGGELEARKIREFLVAVHDCYWPDAEYEFDVEAYPPKLATYAEGFVEVDSNGGLCAVVLGYVNDMETKISYISYIARLPSAVARGADLHLAFEGLARERGMCAIRLEVLKENVRARAFYNRLGYRQIEDRDNRMLLEKTI
jgi:ribosomal protein S18 acetylase RimI-like enzyme